MFGKSPTKWRQHSNMTKAVDWDAKPQINQLNWFKLYLFELKQISNTYKYIQYKLGSERKPMAYEVNFLKSSKLQKRQLQDDSM